MRKYFLEELKVNNTNSQSKKQKNKKAKERKFAKIGDRRPDLQLKRIDNEFENDGKYDDDDDEKFVKGNTEDFHFFFFSIGDPREADVLFADQRFVTYRG